MNSHESFGVRLSRKKVELEKIKVWTNVAPDEEPQCLIRLYRADSEDFLVVEMTEDDLTNLQRAINSALSYVDRCKRLVAGVEPYPHGGMF